MVVDDADGLEVGVDGDAADKFEAALFHVLGDALAQFARGRALVCFVSYDCLLGELPNVSIEAAECCLHLLEGLSVGDGGFYFSAVADNA